jgi:hypothetical protein
MSLESTAPKAVADGAKVVKQAEKLVKKIWSLMDAAEQKTPPGEYLSPRAIRSIQGRHPQ